MAKWYDPKAIKVEHMGFGIVLGEEGKRMKTRGGQTVRLMTLLDEAKQRAMETLKSRGGDAAPKKEVTEQVEVKPTEEDETEHEHKTKLTPEEYEDAAERLGIAAIKYFDLRQNRTQNYKFDFDTMLTPTGDTAVYLIYSYARVCSIIRKSGIPTEVIAEGGFKFTEDHERKLAAHLVKFTEMIESVNNDGKLNTLCGYTYTLSRIIATGYDCYRVLGNENTHSRVCLFEAVRRIMEKCFDLLGIKPLERI